MPIMLTVCGVATIAGAGYLGALSFEALADDMRSHLARWSQVWTDIFCLVCASAAILTALHSILAAWLP